MHYPQGKKPNRSYQETNCWEIVSIACIIRSRCLVSPCKPLLRKNEYWKSKLSFPPAHTDHSNYIHIIPSNQLIVTANRFKTVSTPSMLIGHKNYNSESLGIRYFYCVSEVNSPGLASPWVLFHDLNWLSRHNNIVRGFSK